MPRGPFSILVVFAPGILHDHGMVDEVGFAFDLRLDWTVGDMDVDSGGMVARLQTPFGHAADVRFNGRTFGHSQSAIPFSR